LDPSGKLLGGRQTFFSLAMKKMKKKMLMEMILKGIYLSFAS